MLALCIFLAAVTPAVSAEPPEAAESLLIEADKAATSPANLALDKLKLAKRHRLQRSFEIARRTLTTLLEGEAPTEIKREALLELASVEQQDNQLVRAQQILSQYTSKFPQDSAVPEVFLRQGLLYRQMGSPGLALAKFYAVMTSALGSRAGDLEHHQRLVLLAQKEIADTYYLNGKYAEASDFLARLLKRESNDLNKADIHLKLVRCAVALKKNESIVTHATDFLARYPNAPDVAEVHFARAHALQEQGQIQAALRQVMELLKAAPEGKRATNWLYWEGRAGNEIANQLYAEGDYANALEVYKALAAISTSPAWQVPVWYQIGLTYERLEQPVKAAEAYAQIEQAAKKNSSNTANLKTVLEMAQWRTSFLAWQSKRQTDINNPGPEAQP